MEHPRVKRLHTLINERSLEGCTWVVIALIASGRFWFVLAVLRRRFGSNVVGEFYFDLLLGVICLLIPILYRLNFGLLPFEHVRSRSLRTTGDANKSFVIASSAHEILDLSELNPHEVLARFVQSSSKLSVTILTRAGVYLMIGGLVAFLGVVFFYLQTAHVSELQSAYSTESAGVSSARQLVALAPRFGMLVFIELVAFFFLRQYRTAMEEFRHFESIQRKREETFALIQFLKDDGGKVHFDKLFDMQSFFSGVPKLSPGESTELLELKKLTKDESDVLLKLAELLVQARK